MSAGIPEDAEYLLTSEPLVAHLGTCHANIPHSAPLWYNYRDGTIEIATTGRKLENIRRNSRVALSVQKDRNGNPLWGVALQGTAEIIDDGGSERPLLGRINRRYGEEDDAWSENTSVEINIDEIAYWEY